MGLAQQHGAELAPPGRGEALLDAGLVRRLSVAGRDVREVVTASLAPEDRENGRTAVNIGKLGASTASLVAAARRTGDGALVLAGDDTAAVGVIAGLQQAHGAGARIGIVWLDAHGDFNTPETSPSGNLHGMPLAALCGEPGLSDLFADPDRPALDPTHVHLFGLRSIDAGERALVAARNVEVTDMRHID